MNAPNPPSIPPFRWTAVEVRTLLFFRYATWPLPKDSGSEDAAVVRLMRLGLLAEERDGAKYFLTDKGCAAVEMILTTPLPVEQWADPRV